jgi:hypothetical protein
MKRLLILIMCIAVVAGVAVAVINDVSAQEQGAVVECSWGQIKCCYAGCVNQCCPRPKDEG